MTFLVWYAAVTAALLAVFALLVVVQWCAHQVRSRLGRAAAPPEEATALPAGGPQAHAA